MRNAILVVAILFVGCGSEPVALGLSDAVDLVSVDNTDVKVEEGEVTCLFPLYSQCKYASDCAHEECSYATCEMAVDEDGVCAHLCVYYSVECPEGQACWKDECCQPLCDSGWECGDDGCGGNCGICPGPQYSCINAVCVCKPDCDKKQCGDDGCDGSCGECVVQGEECVDNLCQCVPKCEGTVCGSDGCGGYCNLCPSGMSCLNEKCVSNTETICNDGDDNDADKFTDCSDIMDCDGVKVGVIEFKVTQAWYFAHTEFKWVKLECVDDKLFKYERIGSLEENIGFAYEQFWSTPIRCPPTAVTLSGIDTWIKTDGNVLISNTSPYSIFVFEYLESKWEYVDGIGDGFGLDYEECYWLPSIYGGGYTTVAPFAQAEFGLLPANEERVIMVRWHYNELPPPK